MLSLAARRTETTTNRPRSDQAVVAAKPYDPHLIESLKSDHASLKATLELLEHYILHQEFEKIPGMLARFSDALQHHMNEERDHFYRYVAFCVQADAAKSEFVERTNARMEGIARQVLIFIRHYKSIGISRVNKDAFRHDLEVISDLLGERIELEETSLYALYQPDHGHGHGWIDTSHHEREYATG